MQYWLVKQEPDEYPWTALVRDGRTAWTGVRNFQARNHLRAMRRGNPVLYYHSGRERQIVGLAIVVREAYPDPTAREGDWSCVDLQPLKPLARPVTLDEIKADAALRELTLVRQPRLSVMPLSAAQFRRLLRLGRTRL